MPQILLSEIWRYPVKSLRGARHQSLSVNARGFTYDRHWMLVDGNGKFLTQRQLPRMALIDTWLSDDGELTLKVENQEYQVVTVNQPESIQIEVWDDICTAQAIDPKADAWLSEFLGHPCRLVLLRESSVRQVDQAYANPQDQVGFADGFPFLLISQASLDDLNQRLTSPILMQRFRPNLVVSGCGAFAEDGWKHIRIGGIGFRVAKPCSRCIVPTIDPQTAQRDNTIMQTLLAYRKHDNKVYFGQNLLHDAIGELSEGMPVEVIG